MKAISNFVSRWGAAIIVMLVIFVLSSRLQAELPQFGWADAVVKKGGHVFGYGLLALSYWHALRWRPERIALAWGLAMLYGTTDELHQAFVPGRHPSALDVLLFDNTGAVIALWAKRRLWAGASRPARLRPGPPGR